MELTAQQRQAPRALVAQMTGPSALDQRRTGEKVVKTNLQVLFCRLIGQGAGDHTCRASPTRAATERGAIFRQSCLPG